MANAVGHSNWQWLNGTSLESLMGSREGRQHIINLRDQDAVIAADLLDQVWLLLPRPSRRSHIHLQMR